ncbi:MAG: nicotinamide-nucleotide amidohydrolase family protein [Bacteroidales bacterium]|nr:nicotinamide-nucleotide amidohydrolase family protein [Bacteroidales bacterium]
MKIEIINIGDEILIGQVINTNAAWMAEELNRNGFKAFQFTVISDSREHILQALEDALNRADVVLISGGLGPTKDDITKETICEFFDTKLIFSEEAFQNIETLFSRRGYTVTEVNRKQAELPESCISLPNRLGTARGMLFERRTKEEGRRTKDEGRGTKDEGRETKKLQTANCKLQTVFIFLPGVPFEMKDMFTREVIPRLKERFAPQAIYHKTVLTQGKGESFIADILEDWENNLPEHIKLAYLPQPGIVRLRLSTWGSEEDVIKQEVESEISKLHQLIPELIFGFDNDTLESIVGQLLMQHKQTLSIAESATGGYIAHLVTSLSGSSAWFQGSVVAYSNRSKEDILYVKRDTLESHGAVSEQVALEMALGARGRFRTDYAIATTGIAGPSGETPDKPVGTFWIGIATPDGVFAKHFLFGDNRERNIRRTAVTALNLLRKEILTRPNPY